MNLTLRIPIFLSKEDKFRLYNITKKTLEMVKYI